MVDAQCGQGCAARGADIPSFQRRNGPTRPGNRMLAAPCFCDITTMVVMIVGASGFIGGRLAQAFGAAGHEVICASRDAGGQPPAGCTRSIRIDFTAPSATEWAALLAGVDVLINAVGILRESGEQTFDNLHVLGPRALFTAAAWLAMSALRSSVQEGRPVG